MTNNKRIEPMYVTEAPQDATLVGIVRDTDAVQIDTAIQGTPEYAWTNGIHDDIRKGLIQKAAQKFGSNGERLFLVEGLPDADFDFAGVIYNVSAEVYRAK